MENLIEKMKSELKKEEEIFENLHPLNHEERCLVKGNIETLKNCIHWAEIEMLPY